MRKMIETYQRNIKEIESDLQEKKSDENEAQKYEILYQKEREINEFMEKFEEEKTTYEKEIGQHQTMIAALLEHINKEMEKQAAQGENGGQTDAPENSMARAK